MHVPAVRAKHGEMTDTSWQIEQKPDRTILVQLTQLPQLAVLDIPSSILTHQIMYNHDLARVPQDSLMKVGTFRTKST